MGLIKVQHSKDNEGTTGDSGTVPLDKQWNKRQVNLP